MAPEMEQGLEMEAAAQVLAWDSVGSAEAVADQPLWRYRGQSIPMAGI
jgi:hypothetical protein